MPVGSVAPRWGRHPVAERRGAALETGGPDRRHPAGGAGCGTSAL